MVVSEGLWDLIQGIYSLNIACWYCHDVSEARCVIWGPEIKE